MSETAESVQQVVEEHLRGEEDADWVWHSHLVDLGRQVERMIRRRRPDSSRLVELNERMKQAAERVGLRLVRKEELERLHRHLGEPVLQPVGQTNLLGSGAYGVVTRTGELVCKVYTNGETYGWTVSRSGALVPPEGFKLDAYGYRYACHDLSHELLALRQLTGCEYIIQPAGWCTVSGLPAMVMPFAGKSLYHALFADDFRSMNLSQRLALALQLVEAVNFMHQNGMYHRDVKDGNVLYDGQMRLADMGGACTQDVCRSTRTSVTTVSWLPPRTIANSPSVTGGGGLLYGQLESTEVTAEESLRVQYDASVDTHGVLVMVFQLIVGGQRAISFSGRKLDIKTSLAHGSMAINRLANKFGCPHAATAVERCRVFLEQAAGEGETLCCSRSVVNDHPFTLLPTECERREEIFFRRLELLAANSRDILLLADLHDTLASY